MHDGLISPGPIWDDVRTFYGGDFRSIDLIYGGSPCQQLSNNNPMGKGLEGKESSLFYEFTRIISEARPKFVFLENVQGLVSKNLSEVTLEFSKLGYDCEWLVLPASKVGAPHLRKRFFLYAVSHSNCDRWNGRISDFGEGHLFSTEESMEKGKCKRDRGELPSGQVIVKIRQEV